MISCPSCHSQISGRSGVCAHCGGLYCPSCIRPTDHDSTYCRFCGEELNRHCPDCGSEVTSHLSFCPECGLDLADKGPILVPEYTRIRENDRSDEGESYNGTCPNCHSGLFIEDGFCPECGQAICTACGETIDEADNACPECGTQLFFACPLCDFELMAGSDMCPNCNALLPNVCSHCDAMVERTDTACPACHRPLTIQPRYSARTIRTFLVGRKLVRMVACPGCGRNLNPASGPCTGCGSRVCSECQLILYDGEKKCPRCTQPISEVPLSDSSR